MSFDLIITNDPDHGITKDYIPIFKELSNLDIKVTTAVFADVEKREDFPGKSRTLASHCYPGETNSLSDPHYRDLMLEIKDLGHEIAYHGYSQVNNTAEYFARGIEIYEDIFGEKPFTYMEHGGNPFKSHPPEMCKKETLDVLGKKKGSKYYVWDLIKESFGITWAHHELLDDDYDFVDTDKMFYMEGDNLMFRRHRMYYLETILDAHGKDLSEEERKLFIGYTHFGYKGYSSLPHGTLESWCGSSLPRAISKLEAIKKEYNPKSYTLREYVEKKL